MISDEFGKYSSLIVVVKEYIDIIVEVGVEMKNCCYIIL